MDLKELEGWEADLSEHWYYASKAAALDRLLAKSRFRSVVDVGAGSGFFSRHLLEHYAQATCATCVDVNYAADSDETIGGKRVAYRRDGRDAVGDLYLLMDVLEHVEDDVGLLASCVARAPGGATFVLSVPAFAFLWSGHDVYLGHHRRYSLRRIAGVARRAGLVVEKSCYFYGAIFPAVAAVRLARRARAGHDAPRSDMRALPPSVNALLKAVCFLEERVFTVNRLFGLTAFVVARVDQDRAGSNAQ